VNKSYFFVQDPNPRRGRSGVIFIVFNASISRNAILGRPVTFSPKESDILIMICRLRRCAIQKNTKIVAYEIGNEKRKGGR